MTNLENVDMSGKDFSGCRLLGCNLKNTNAVLKLDTLDIKNLWGVNLEGTTLIVNDDFNKEAFEQQDNILGEVVFDEYTLVKHNIQSLIKSLNI